MRYVFLGQSSLKDEEGWVRLLFKYRRGGKVGNLLLYQSAYKRGVDETFFLTDSELPILDDNDDLCDLECELTSDYWKEDRGEVPPTSLPFRWEYDEGVLVTKKSEFGAELGGFIALL